jgi:hypothetical protein
MTQTDVDDRRYLAKILGRDGSTLKLNVPHSAMREPPVFSDRIDGGMGECILDYVVPFDNFDEGVKIDHEFIMDIWCFDTDNPNGRRIYSGVIEEYEPYIEGAQQGVLVKALGLGSKLSYDIYMSSSRTVYAVTHTTQDPETIFKAIIDEWRAFANNALINYAVGSTQAVGSTVSKTFTDRSWWDACADTRELCGSGWWWHVGPDRTAYLLPKPSSPTHKFIIGKHIQLGNFPKSVKGVKNKIRVTRSGGTVTTYTDATSISAYEQRIDIVDDSSLTSAGAADQRGATGLEQKDPRTKSTLTINSEYDLESIKVGQTCIILNSDETSSFFGTNIMIVGLTYNGNTVELELEESTTDLGLALDKFVNG